MASSGLSRNERFYLQLQRTISRLTSPLWIPICVVAMHFVFRWKIEGSAEARREYARLRQSSAPILICANHLTKLDSALVGWALGGATFYLRDFGALAWNLPAREHFAFSWWARIAVYLLKCIPIERGGSREGVAQVLGRLIWLLNRREVGLVFPEGGRSRTGRVEVESAAYGVGRIVKALPGCRVLCVYLRGKSQDSWSDLPKRGDRFHVSVTSFEPKSDQRGLRASVDIAAQVMHQLSEMERKYFEDNA